MRGYPSSDLDVDPGGTQHRGGPAALIRGADGGRGPREPAEDRRYPGADLLLLLLQPPDARVV